MSINSAIPKEDYKKFDKNTKRTLSKYYPLKVQVGKSLTKTVQQNCFGLTRP